MSAGGEFRESRLAAMPDQQPLRETVGVSDLARAAALRAAHMA